MRFTVLASGSAGNASLLEAGDFGLLLDAGLGPRLLAARLASVGRSWQHVNAVILSHTHSDHWNDRTLAHLARTGIPLHCHREHLWNLQNYGTSLPALKRAGLVRTYETGATMPLAPTLRCTPLAVRHDGGATFGFRLDGAPDLFGQSGTVAYLSDLGTWDRPLAQALADAELLAVEFNHDVAMQYASGRSARLVARVLGDRGHLSNVQAAALIREVLCLSGPGRLRHVVQLHLSRECNRPGLAVEALRAALGSQAEQVRIHTASQDEPGPTISLAGPVAGKRRRTVRRSASSRTVPASQPWLPGLEGSPSDATPLD